MLLPFPPSDCYMDVVRVSRFGQFEGFVLFFFLVYFRLPDT